MPKKSINYPCYFSPCELDKILIPKNIENLSFEKQCKYVLSHDASMFRIKAKYLYIAMIKANKNISRGTCANPFYVNWETSKGRFIINGKSLSDYYCRYLAADKGFSGLLFKINEYCERKAYVCQLKKEGKYCNHRY